MTGYVKVNQMLLRRNFHRDAFALFAHLVEVVGGLSLLAADKEKPEVDAQDFVAKALAWWMVLCGKVGVRSVETMVWFKFPRICPYCELRVHSDGVCLARKEQARTTGPRYRTGLP